MLTFDGRARPLTLADVLEAAFPNTSLGAPEGAAQRRRIHVIPQGAEPRWIIIGEPHKALPVLRSWSPWNLRSRLGWDAVKLATGLRVLPRVPGVQNSEANIDASYWRVNLPQFPSDWTAVIHVGNLSHTRKAILFIIGEDGEIRFAAKAPLVSGATEAIFNEASLLDRLRQFEYLPKVLFTDHEQGVAVQSWLDGKPVSRGFTEPHLKLLNDLASPDAAARVSDLRSEVACELNSIDLPFDRSVLAHAVELLDYDEPLPVFVEHRDFAPWNLKWLPDGGLGLLDWEWAITDGLPWQDVCRFFYLDDYHFKGSGKVWEKLTSNSLALRYRQQAEIPPEAIPSLTIRYLLRVLPMDWIGGNRELARYTFAQIQLLLATCKRFVSAGS
jgi:hypothetical protein